VLQAGAVALSVSRTDALWRHLCSRGQNWAYSQSFAQLCYDPVPSLVCICTRLTLSSTARKAVPRRFAHGKRRAQEGRITQCIAQRVIITSIANPED